jgi:dihydroorotate dehydrogenase
MYEYIRPLLFRLDPERAHDLTLRLLRLGGSTTIFQNILRTIYSPKNIYQVDFAGLKFPNLVGLAAGYDKDCTAWRGLSALGFGHIEIGTVTPKPQSGNPKPRIFRIPDQEAVINRMGFPGRGANFVVRMLPDPGIEPARDRIVLGMNIGRNKDTPNETAAGDYISCLRLFYKKVDYFAVNVSSPNTIGLRELQGREFLGDLLKNIIAERDKLREDLTKPLPVFVKLSPDLSDQELDDALTAIIGSSTDGVIATNTTVKRPGMLDPDQGINGGLSGKPLKDLSTSLIRKIHRRTEGKLPIIGVGGINSVEDARVKMDAGAGLVQIYSGLVYKGPALVREIVENL